MLAQHRKDKIKEILAERKSVIVSDLARNFSVTEETIRRDLRQMEQEGLLTRTHGGAFIQQGVQNDVLFSLRAAAYLESKQTIGRLCAEFIHHGDSIFIDASTTSLALCEQIKDLRIAVVTHSLKVADALCNVENISLTMVGGVYSPKSASFEGVQTVQLLERYSFDRAFVSCRTLSLDRGVTDSNETLSMIRATAIKNSKETFIIADHSKFDRSSYIKICDFTDVNYIVSDKLLPPDWYPTMREQRVKIVTP